MLYSFFCFDHVVALALVLVSLTSLPPLPLVYTYAHALFLGCSLPVRSRSWGLWRINDFDFFVHTTHTHTHTHKRVIAVTSQRTTRSKVSCERSKEVIDLEETEEACFNCPCFSRQLLLVFHISSSPRGLRLDVNHRG